MLPQPETLPWWQLAWRLGGVSTYPCANAGVVLNTVVATAVTATASTERVLRMKWLLYMGGDL